MKYVIAVLLAVVTIMLCPIPMTQEPVPVSAQRPPMTAEPSSGTGMAPFTATAYSYTGNRTATGTWPQEGRTIAVDPNVVPLGSSVVLECPTWTEVSGRYIAEDTGSDIKGNRVDIYMSNHEKCLQFGRREVLLRVEH